MQSRSACILRIGTLPISHCGEDGCSWSRFTNQQPCGGRSWAATVQTLHQGKEAYPETIGPNGHHTDPAALTVDTACGQDAHTTRPNRAGDVLCERREARAQLGNQFPGSLPEIPVSPHRVRLISHFRLSSESTFYPPRNHPIYCAVSAPAVKNRHNTGHAPLRGTVPCHYIQELPSRQRPQVSELSHREKKIVQKKRKKLKIVYPVPN